MSLLDLSWELQRESLCVLPPETTSSKSLTTATASAAPPSHAKSPSSIGTTSSVIPPSVTRFSTASSTMPTASLSEKALRLDTIPVQRQVILKAALAGHSGGARAPGRRIAPRAGRDHERRSHRSARSRDRARGVDRHGPCPDRGTRPAVLRPSRDPFGSGPSALKGRKPSTCQGGQGPSRAPESGDLPIRWGLGPPRTTEPWRGLRRPRGRSRPRVSSSIGGGQPGRWSGPRSRRKPRKCSSSSGPPPTQSEPCPYPTLGVVGLMWECCVIRHYWSVGDRGPGGRDPCSRPT